MQTHRCHPKQSLGLCCISDTVSQHRLMQAPVPYLNRAIAEEQLGVDAAAQQNLTLAQQQFAGAVAVS